MSTLAHEKQILEYEKTLAQLKEQNKEHTLWSDTEIGTLEEKLQQLRTKVYSQLSAWDRVSICRHPQRPKSVDFIQHLCEDFVEIYGDRAYRNDRAVICGFAKIEGVKFVVVAQEKGSDTATRLERNFGMMHPEGYRKALRAMNLAVKFKLPVLCLIDTPGAHPGLASEERGQGWAIAHNLFEMARLQTPILAIIIGEGCSGGALGVGIGDRVAMLEHAYYSVISPEGCASILWRDNNKKELAASTLKMHVEDLMKFHIVDAMIEEPLGGAHQDPQVVYGNVKKYILEEWELLKAVDPVLLIELRYQKYRRMGQFSIEENPEIRLN